MENELIAITTLLLGVTGLIAGGRFARRRGIPQSASLGLSLLAIFVGFVMLPAEWQARLANNVEVDRAMSFARDAAIVGLLFLAGLRFDGKDVWKARRISIAVTTAGLIVLILIAALLAKFGGMETGAALVTAAALACASLWVPGDLVSSDKDVIASVASRGAAAGITFLAMLALHLYSALEAVGAARLSAYSAVAAYELVKVALFFGFAYFIASKFIERSEGQISTARMLVIWLVIFALLAALAASAIGMLAAYGWAFVAGATLSRSNASFSKSIRTTAAALPFALVFISTFVQSRGRSLSGALSVMILVFVTLAARFALSLVAARTAGASLRESKMAAAGMLATGETAVIFLSFGVTRWLIEGAAFYAVLISALVSMSLGPILWRAALQENRAGRSKKRKLSLAAAIIGFLALAFQTTARAQSPTDDPVRRAMKSVEATISDRAAAAERAIAASKLVGESVARRKQGEDERAAEALKEAEKIIAEGSEKNFLIEEVSRSIKAERNTIEQKANPSSGFSDTSPSRLSLSRPALARFNAYREIIEQILGEESLPQGLIAVALIESAFNPMAHSPKGARGIWQFMPATARRYGLAVEPGDDHRTHPEHSTRAAAKYLRYLYNRFGDWKLALAAYNAGEARIQRIIDSTRIRDFEEMSRRGLLPVETRRYVPAVMAAWSKFEVGASKEKQSRATGRVADALTGRGDSA
ncbi:MAG: transglycosylase SLT domain-containing protein, partial [Acidobacteriota bacterium]